MTASDTCDWCGDPIDDQEERVEVVRRSPGGLSNREVLAVFHDEELPCYGEASDYGW